jgi:RimJ/RimL family protein N-acetyltransferase
LEDAEAIYTGYAQDEQVTKYATWLPHASMEITREFLRRCIRAWQEKSAFPWVIIRRDENNLIGMVETRIEGHKANLGYVIARPEWGKGYATEAAQAVVSWAIEQPGIMRVWSVCDVENIASARVLEKVSMEREGLLRKYIMHPNVSKKPRDVYCYSLIKE